MRPPGVLEALLPIPPASTPPTGHGLGGGGGVSPVAPPLPGDAGHDPAHGRRSADPVGREPACTNRCGVPRDREPDAVSRPRGPFGAVPSEPMADRLISAGAADDADGPGTESRLAELAHRVAARHARLATALEEALGRPPGDAYVLDRPPGRAPQVVHPPQPVRVGRLLDVLA